MASGQLETKGFGALFDSDFTSFITLRFLTVIYAILVALILLVAVVLFFALLFRGGASVIAAIIVVPLVTLFYLVIARVYMEIIALFFRIGQNTSVIAARLSEGGAPPTGGGYASGGDPYPGPPST